MAFKENHVRSVVKALTYRAIVIIVDSVVIYALTRRVDIAAGFVVISNIYTTFIYFLHERAWNEIHWGKSHIKHK